MARFQPRHPHRPQGQRLDRRQRREGRAHPEVHPRRPVPDADGQARRQQGQQRSRQLRPRGQDLGRPQDQRSLCGRRLQEQARGRARRRHGQDEAVLGRLRQPSQRRRSGQVRPLSTAAAAVPQPGALRGAQRGRSDLCLRPPGQPRAGLQARRHLREGGAFRQADAGLGLGLGPRVLARPSAALHLPGRRHQ